MDSQCSFTEDWGLFELARFHAMQGHRIHWRAEALREATSATLVTPSIPLVASRPAWTLTVCHQPRARESLEVDQECLNKN